MNPKTDKNIITWKATPEAKKTFEVWRTSGSKESLCPGAFEVVRQALEQGMPNVLPEAELTHKLDHFTCGGSEVYTLSGDSDKNIVLFIHGGAWVMPMIDEQLTFCDKLVEPMNATVYMPLYPLGPKYGYLDTYEMLLTLYKELLKQDKPIYMMGDSAGGQLTLMLATIIRDQGLRAPEKIAVLAPAADLSFTNPEIPEVELRDPRLALFGTVECTKMWTKGTDPKSPVLSLNYADLRNLPDTMIFGGTCDILFPDDKILFERMKEAGNNVTLVVGDGLWHVFSTASIPEREKTLELIREFCLGKEGQTEQQL